MRRFALLAAFLLCSAPAVHADDLNAIFKKVNEYVAAKNYSKALDELGWAKKEIGKLHLERLKAFVPASIAGLPGEEVEVNNALGLINVERNYQKGDASVRFSLSGGSGGEAAAGFGNLAAFGKMAAMMGGGQPGQDTFRIGGRTATLTEDKASQTSEITVFLDSGLMLRPEGNQVSGAQLREAVNNLKLDELDAYLKGA